MSAEVTIEPTAAQAGWDVQINGKTVLHVRPDYDFPLGKIKGWRYYRTAKMRFGMPYCRVTVDGGEQKAIDDAVAYAKRWINSGIARGIS